MTDPTGVEPAEPGEIHGEDLDAIAGGIIILGNGGNGGAGSSGPTVSPPA